ncbi:MAG: methyltransferase domain-containing protein, partial [Candidatus Riflebacteria bacterium]
MNQENESRDRIFARKLEELSSFRFDDQVAEVFPDMLQRSIPGYGAIISMIETLTARFAQPGSNLYDLGCSLGASSLSMQHGLKVEGCRIVAVDNSAAMIGRCVKNNDLFKGLAEVEFICEDISKIEISNASVVVLNFTLQFIDPDKRCDLLRQICA